MGAVGGLGDGLRGQVRVTLGGLHEGMAEQFCDGDHVYAVHRGVRSPSVAQVMKPHTGQARFLADAGPIGLDVDQRPRRRTHGKQIRALWAVAGNGVDHRTRGARQPHRAWPGLAVRELDAFALDPVPFELDDLPGATPREQQQADDGDDLRTIELVADEHRIQPADLLGGQEPFLGRRPVSLGVLAGAGVMNPVAPQLGPAHHLREHRHGTVGCAGPLAQGGEPILHLFPGDGIDGEMAERGQDVNTDHHPVGFQGPRFPMPGLAFEELGGERLHGMPGCAGSSVVLERFDKGDDQFAGFVSGLGHGHIGGVAEGGIADAPAHQTPKKERAYSAGTNAHAQAADHVVPEFVFLIARLSGADAPGGGEGFFFGHVGGSWSVKPRGGRQNRKQPRRRLCQEAARWGETGYTVR